MKWFVDGGGFNGEVSKFCVTNEEGLQQVEVVKEEKTNNEMEYRALLHCLELCADGDEIVTDSKLVEGQVTKGWRCNYSHLLPLRNQAIALITTKKVKLSWTRRGGNEAGRLLDRLKEEGKRLRRKENGTV